MDQYIVELISIVIDFYIIILFIRMFLTASERYDAVLEMVYRATDPLVTPLGTGLRRRRVDLAPLVVIAALLLIEGMLWGSIPYALQRFVSRLFQLYVLIIIIMSGFREYYINPLTSFGQRVVNPVRALAANFSRQVLTVNLLSVLLLLLAHVVISLVLGSLVGRLAINPVKGAVIGSVSLILDLTWFFIYVIIINALISWFSPDPGNPFVQLLAMISAPLVDPIRRVIPPLGGMLDISPIVAIIGLRIAYGIGQSVLNQL